MLVLGIDTASPLVTVALYGSGLSSGVRACAQWDGAQAHGELLAPTIADLLSAQAVSTADLTRVVVGVGPGPFTGLRVGIVTARVLGEALGVPVSGVCSLDAVGLDAAPSIGRPFSVVTDARRHEVYAASYDSEGVRHSSPTVSRPEDLDADVRTGPTVGAGADLYASHFTDRRPCRDYAEAWLALLGALETPDRVQLLDTTPLYLRRPDAVANVTRKRVTPA